MVTIGISLIWVSFLTVTTLPKWLDFKPFNCVVCLSFWSILIANLVIEENLIISLSLAGIGAYVSMIAKRILFKI